MPSAADTELGQRLAFAAEMRALDARAIEHYGMPSLALMENAGRAVALVADELVGSFQFPVSSFQIGQGRGLRRHSGARLAPPDLGHAHSMGGGFAPRPYGAPAKPTRIVIACGAGNNAGDGFVAARHLQAMGYAPLLVCCAEPAKLRGDALLYDELALRCGVPCVDASEAAVPDPAALQTLLAEAGSGAVLAIDALLGTGARGAPRGRIAEAIGWLNRLPCPCLAVDLPSGIDADTGNAAGSAVRATCTVSFGAAKPGLLLGAGREHCGELRVVDIGLPAPAFGELGLAGVWLRRDALLPLFAPRPCHAHKGDFGFVSVLGGAPGMLGAGLLCGRAALTGGAGRVSLATHRRSAEQVALAAPELMSDGVWDEPGVDATTLDGVLGKATVLVVGPGLGKSPAAREALQRLLGQATCPVVADADALNLLAREPALRLPPGSVLTPHPGEAARLLGQPRDALLTNPIATARVLAQRYQAVAVLKGASTVVAEPSGRYAINTYGNPGMATAGSGDVLAGLIAAWLAQGASAWVASCAGVCLHALAGDLAARRTGQRALVASGILAALPELMREAEAQANG